MTTHEKTICLARLIGLEHKTVDARVVATRAVAWTDGSVEWRWYPWRPYECEADLEPIRRWLTNQHSYWLHGWDMAASVDGCQQTPAMLCDAVLAAFAPEPEPTQAEIDAEIEEDIEAEHECGGRVLLYVQPPGVQRLIDKIDRMTAELAAMREAERNRRDLLARVFEQMFWSTNPEPRPVVEPQEGESDGE